MNNNFKKKDKPIISKRRINDKASVILSTILLMFVIVFFINNEFYINSDVSVNIFWTRIFKTILIYVFILLIIRIKLNINEKINFIISLSTLMCVPVINFLLIEYLNGSTLSEITVYKIVINVIILFIIMVMWLAITGSIKFAGILTTMFSCLFGMTCFYLMNFKGAPLLFSDILNMRTGFEVAGNYSFDIDFKAYVYLLLSFAFCVCLLLQNKLKIKNWKIRISACCVFIISAYLLVDIVVIKQRTGELYINPWDPIVHYREHGTYLSFLSTARVTLVEKPKGYSPDIIDTFTQDYINPENEESSKPNIIVILNESFSDLQNLGYNFQTNKEVLPFYNSLSENTIKGTCYSTVYSGGTINPEFEILSSCSLYYFPSNSFPYIFNLKSETPSFVSVLKEQGYGGSIAIHPENRNNYNRLKMYKYLGFDEFLGKKDFENPHKVGKFISDKTVYEKLINEYESHTSKSEDPFSAFLLTMQNHGAYTDTFTKLPLDIKIVDDFSQEEKGLDDEVEKALNLMHLSDKAIEDLVEYFDKVDDDTIIVFAGDHQPFLPEAFYTKILQDGNLSDIDKKFIKHKVPFFIWANYDIEEQYYEHMSFNYLSPLAFEAAGMKSPGFYKQLVEMSKEIPAINAGGFFDKNGTYYDRFNSQIPSHYNKLILNNNYSVYNNVIDTKNRVNSFFYDSH